MARGVAERLRKAVESGAGVTISLGVSSYDENVEKMEDLIAGEDKALYQAKQNGRNKVEVVRSLDMSPGAPAGGG